jgi:hypothetical protein
MNAEQMAALDADPRYQQLKKYSPGLFQRYIGSIDAGDNVDLQRFQQAEKQRKAGLDPKTGLPPGVQIMPFGGGNPVGGFDYDMPQTAPDFGNYDNRMPDLPTDTGIYSEQYIPPTVGGGDPRFIAPPMNPGMGGPYTPRPDLGPGVGFGVGLPQPGYSDPFQAALLRGDFNQTPRNQYDVQREVETMFNNPGQGGGFVPEGGFNFPGMRNDPYGPSGFGNPNMGGAPAFGATYQNGVGVSGFGAGLPQPGQGQLPQEMGMSNYTIGPDGNIQGYSTFSNKPNFNTGGFGGQQGLQSAFSPQGNNFGGGGFMGGSGSMFGGGGFAGK